MPISPEYDHDHDECERHASEHVGPAVRQHVYQPKQQRRRDRDPDPEGPLLPRASKRLHPQCPGCRC